MKKETMETMIEEQVKRAFEGNLLWAYCSAISRGVERYYHENHLKYDGFAFENRDGEVIKKNWHDDTYLEKVKEAYSLIKDVLNLDGEEDLLMDERKRMVGFQSGRYADMRREAKRDKQKVLDCDAEFIAEALKRHESCKTTEDLIAEYDYQIVLNDRLDKEAKAIKKALTPKTIRDIEEKICIKRSELHKAKFGLEHGGTDAYKEECEAKIPKLEKEIAKLEKRLRGE